MTGRQFHVLYKMGLLETFCFVRFGSKWYSGKAFTWLKS